MCVIVYIYICVYLQQNTYLANKLRHNKYHHPLGTPRSPSEGHLAFPQRTPDFANVPWFRLGKFEA